MTGRRVVAKLPLFGIAWRCGKRVLLQMKTIDLRSCSSRHSCASSFPLRAARKSSPAPACQIITVRTSWVPLSTTYNVTYNNAGQISTEQYSISGSPITGCSRISAILRCCRHRMAPTPSSDSITLNSDGLVLSAITIHFRSTSRNDLYLFGDRIAKGGPGRQWRHPCHYDLTWTNGDLTNSSSSGGIHLYLQYESQVNRGITGRLFS